MKRKYFYTLGLFVFTSSLFFFQKTYGSFKTKKNESQSLSTLQIQEQLKKIKTQPYISANFIQKRSTQKLGLKEVITQTSGVFKLAIEKKATKFFWSTKNSKSENIDLYVSNGNDLWSYNYITKYAQKLQINKIGLEFIEIFKNISAIEQLYALEPWSAPPQTEERLLHLNPPSSNSINLPFRLIPKEISRTKFIYCNVLKDKGVINELRIQFEDGSRTQMIFSEFNFDKIEDSQFEFTPPKGPILKNEH